MYSKWQCLTNKDGSHYVRYLLEGSALFKKLVLSGKPGELELTLYFTESAKSDDRASKLKHSLHTFSPIGDHKDRVVFKLTPYPQLSFQGDAGNFRAQEIMQAAGFNTKFQDKVWNDVRELSMSDKPAQKEGERSPGRL